MEDKNALVLRRIPYGESDWILSLFPEEGNKISVFAAGARNSKKRFGSSLDLFNLVSVTFDHKPGRDLPLLNEAYLVEGFVALRNDLTKFSAASFFGEMISEFLPEKDPQHKLYQAFLGFLRTMESQAFLPDHFIPLMEHQLLSHFGFQPRFTSCLICQEKLKASQSYYFHGAKGGVVCLACHENTPVAHSVYLLDYFTIQKMLSQLGRVPQDWPKESWGADETLKMRKALEYFIQFTVGKPLKSLNFLSQILLK